MKPIGFAIRLLSTWPQIQKEIRATFGLALPLFGGQLSALGITLINVMLAGRLGPHVLAPIALGSSIWMLAVIIFYGVMMALQTSVAQLDGAGRRAEVGPLFLQALWLNVMLSMVLMAAEYLLGPLLIQTMVVTPELVRDTRAFLNTICLAGPALGIFCACRGLSEGLSRARLTLAFILLGLVLTGPVGYVFMYGALGVPALGAVGSGIALVIVAWIQALAFLFYVCRSDCYRDLRRQIGSKIPNLRVMFDLLKFGVSVGITRLMEGGFFIASALVIGRAGAVAVANHEIAMSVEAIACTVSYGLSIAISVRVAQAYGRGNPAEVSRAGFTGIAMTLGTQLLSAGLILLIPGAIVSLYTQDPAMTASVAILIQLAGLLQISDGLQTACWGALRGVRDMRMPIVITFFAYWVVGMPVGWWLSITRNWGATGMWIGLLVGLTLAAGVLFSRFVWVSSPARLNSSSTLNSRMLLPSKS
ncbi:MATE family efflux transporter [Mycoavidus sp. SF9855]|uniref:MATE family efflux transporter n=1 Tax=Mycoavidus sp. SF9855 TaxID=2968475 RepID=UPI00211C81C5|nr:MATE family efflux transporter [Mycoavidus sp. SF9855]UUM20788.1 MATE family efflux transporter [Mycoavidus sp. SF9855]